MSAAGSYFAAAVAALAALQVPPAQEPPVVLYLARRHWHIDVGFAVRDLTPSLTPVARRFPEAHYLFFGFGDRHYLLSRHKGSTTLSGALFPGPGVILATAIENTPAQAFGASQVLEFDLSSAHAGRLQEFIRRSIGAAGDAPGIAPLGEGPYEGSLYYAARVRYSALNTCNTWAAAALQAGGLRVRTRLVIFAGQLWKQARALASRPAPRARSRTEGVLAPELTRPQSQGGGLPF